MSGTTLVHSRRHFQKRFDLAERLMPDALALPPLAAADFQRWHLRQSLHAMGAATEMDLRMYLTLPARGRRRAPPLARPPARNRRGARDRRAGAGSAGPGRGGMPWPRICPPSRRRDDAGSPPRAPPCSPPSTPSCGTASAPTASSASATRSRSTRPATSAPTATTRCPSSTTASSSAASTRRSTAPSAASRSRACTSSPGSPAEPSLPPRPGARLDRDAALAGLADTLRSLATFVGADPDAITLGSVAPASLRAPLKRRL